MDLKCICVILIAFFGVVMAMRQYWLEEARSGRR